MTLSVTKHKLSFTFTELLYGVLIGAALQNVKEFSATRENGLLFLAVLLVADDYFMYYQDVKNRGVAETLTKKMDLTLFFLDILVLGAWYSLSLASQATSGGFYVPLADWTTYGSPYMLFLFWVTMYYLAISLWDKVFPTDRQGGHRLEWLPAKLYWVFDNHILIALAAAVCTVVSWYKPEDDPRWLLYFLCFLLVWRGITYWDFLKRPGAAAGTPGAPETEREPGGGGGGLYADIKKTPSDLAGALKELNPFGRARSATREAPERLALPTAEQQRELEEALGARADVDNESQKDVKEPDASATDRPQVEDDNATAAPATPGAEPAPAAGVQPDSPPDANAADKK